MQGPTGRWDALAPPQDLISQQVLLPNNIHAESDAEMPSVSFLQSEIQQWVADSVP